MTADGPIVFISRSRIRPGKLDGLRSFLAFVDESSMTLTIVHLFANTAGFAAHVEGADDRSAAAATFIEPLAMEIHGAPDPGTIAAIRSGLPSDVTLLIGTDYLGGFLRMSGQLGCGVTRAGTPRSADPVP